MDNQTELSVAIVDALKAWGTVEIELTQLFSILADFPIKSEHDFNHKAHLIFDTIHSFETRLDIVDVLMANSITAEVDQEIWNRCSLRLRKLYKRRHGLAHFIFDGKINNDGSIDYHVSPFFTIGAAMREELTPLSVPQITERKAHFEEVVQAISYFEWHALDRRGRTPGTPWPEPPIVARFRASASQILEERQKRQRSAPLKSETEDY